MIKFFRKIRQKMLTENKFSKYLIYAIGEIILVVIGILIALQINNWNEQRKIQGNQEKYLMLLKTEALNNLLEVDKAINIASTRNLWQTKIFNLIDGKQDTITEEYISNAFGQIYGYTYSFRYENSALSELKTSGDLKNVLNDSLRKYLIAQEPLVLKVQGQEQNVIQDFEESSQYIKKNGSFRTMADNNGGAELLGIPKLSNTRSSNIHLLGKDEFENNLLTYTGTTKNLVSNHYPRLKNHLKKIIEIIELELEDK
tara:strand:- start:359 stop:1129 length:771 start_codon:yes stop_codon:yes gene_type:complete